MADEKRPLRVTLSEARAALSAERVAEFSAAAQRHLLTLEVYRACSTVVLYSPKDNEVLTDLILSEAIAARRKVFYPRVEPAAGRLRLIRVKAADQLSPGAFGILEPAAEGEAAQPGALGDAVVCVPGLAFSPCGQRLGRGGGYYDRLLAELAAGAVTVGLAYSFQLLNRLPEHDGDRRLCYVVTECGVRAPVRADDGGGSTKEVHPGGISDWTPGPADRRRNRVRRQSGARAGASRAQQS